MTRPARGLLHTSVFIAAESGRPLDEQLMPDETVISEIRARRMATLDAVADVELIGIDEATALMWARMRVHLVDAGRRVNVNDLWIAASAASRGLPVVTQDDEFGAVAGVGGLKVIRV